MSHLKFLRKSLLDLNSHYEVFIKHIYLLHIDWNVYFGRLALCRRSFAIVMQKIHLLMGVVIIFVGIFWPYVSRIPLGKLPLDVDLKLGNIQFYLPIGSSVLFSFVLTILLNLLK